MDITFVTALHDWFGLIRDFFDNQFRPIVVVFGGALALYLGTQKITQKIVASLKISMPRHSEIYISSIVLSNMRDRATSVWAIYAVFNKEFIMEIGKFDTPLIIKSYESIQVLTSKFSDLTVNNDKYKPDYFSDHIEIYVDAGSKFLKCHSFIKQELATSLEKIQKLTMEYNGFVYNDSVLYILDYTYEKKMYTAFIDSGGFIGNEWSFTPNFVGMSPFSANDIHSALKSNGLDRVFEHYACYRVNRGNLQHVFQKALILDRPTD